jgi:hypothetical protein
MGFAASVAFRGRPKVVRGGPSAEDRPRSRGVHDEDLSLALSLVNRVLVYIDAAALCGGGNAKTSAEKAETAEF